MRPLTGSDGIIQLTPNDIVADPFPHAIKQDIFHPEFYRELKAEFPSDNLFDNRGKHFGARTGRDLYQGDPGFDEMLESRPAWREFYRHMRSREFLQFTMDLFGQHLKKFECRVDPQKAQLVDYTESRLTVWWRARKARWFGSSGSQDPNDLFVRFDIEQSDKGYDKPIHCDNPSRLVSFLVYFCDADDLRMEGGDLHIHEHLQKKPYSHYERSPADKDTRIVDTLRPRENLGVFFLCSNNSYHSVTAIKRMNDYRRFIYMNLSSRADSIW